jgi:hypothetical protein
MTKVPSQDDELLILIAKQRKVYDRIRIVNCPIIKNKVRFNIAGFRHLHTDGRGHYRPKNQAVERLELFRYAVGVVENCRILRTDIHEPHETESGKREVYYNLFARVGERQIKVMLVIRAVGNGDPHFYGIRRN